nr:Type 1 glutamine amidotransferase-like domain-containing protein [uncultured Microbacterium sp.]
MNLLLLSLGVGAVPGFLSDRAAASSEPLRLGYVADAAAAFADAPFVHAERAAIEDLGYRVRELTARTTPAHEFAAALDEIDALYVAGGNTFALLAALRANGAADAIVRKVHDGLPYIGLSAGSIVAGSSIRPAALMDDPKDAPDLTDHTGLNLISEVVIPHADGALPPYPPELIRRTVELYGGDHTLILLEDDEALLVDEDGSRRVSSPG